MKPWPVTVEDLMTTAVITIKAGDPVERAWEQMRIPEVRHLPVVDERNHVIGVLSNRDLRGAEPGRGRVADVMSRRPVTVRPDTSASVAAETMLEKKIGSLPVVGEDEQLIGIITETDFLEVARLALLGADAEVFSRQRRR